MLRARLFWRWCRLHPKASGIGGAFLALFVIAGAFGDSGQKTKPTAAGSSAIETPSAQPSSAAAAPTSTTSTTSAAPRPSPSSLSVAPVDRTQRGQSTAIALLATVPIKGRAAKTGYARDQFGTAWTDYNNNPLGHNGCDTRNDVLRRDLTSVALKPNSNGCSVLTGVLRDPYTAATIKFVRGETTSSAVQIDHVVALSDAWQTGASLWTEQTRTDLANDPLNLLAVDGSANEAKGDGDAATWLPPNKAYRCAYVARQVAVKARYQLWTTQAEHDAIGRVLAACPSQTAPTESGTASIQLAPRTTATRTTPRPAPATTHYYTTPPAPVVAPGGGATAQCNDGSFSYAAHHQGACSRHGGVRIFYK